MLRLAESRGLARQSATRRVTNARELVATVHDTSVETIIVAAGTYELTNSTPGLCRSTVQRPSPKEQSDIADPVGLPPPIYEWHSFDAWYSALCITDRHLSIIAERNGTVVLNATRQSWRVIYVDGGGRAELVGLNITGGFAGYGGGLLIASGGQATLTSCAITGNVATLGGGGLAIWKGGGQATLTSCTISENKAAYGGGVGIGDSGNITMTECVISENEAMLGYGGGGLAISGQASLTSCTISGNEAAQGGGLLIDGTANLTSCTISGNVAMEVRGDGSIATQFGGAGGLKIGAFGKASLTSCTISGNDATSKYGGGLFVLGEATLSSCLISENKASYGAGLSLMQSASDNTMQSVEGKATLSDCMLIRNRAAVQGGGILMKARSTMYLLSSTVTITRRTGAVEGCIWRLQISGILVVHSSAADCPQIVHRSTTPRSEFQ